MNLNAAKLRMFSSNFDSPHGLINKYNYSTAYDVCIMTTHCMKNPTFREVVRTKAYTAKPFNRPQEESYYWENTNKLLSQEGFIGCKTGVTDVAGPCFSGCFEGSGERLCIVVLNSKSLE